MKFWKVDQEKKLNKKDNYENDIFENGKWGNFSGIPENLISSLLELSKFLEILPI